MEFYTVEGRVIFEVWWSHKLRKVELYTEERWSNVLEKVELFMIKGGAKYKITWS